MRHWQRENGCWIWTSSKNSHGYGLFALGKADGRTTYTSAHRFAYEMFIGPIPDGLTIDHLCRNRACVNPFHLEAVTLAANIYRSESVSAKNAGRLFCKNGHAYDEANTYWRPTGGRACRKCKAKSASITRAQRLSDEAYLNGWNSPSMKPY